jgi:L-lactate dehydrogenase complex protein LldF
VSADKTQGDLRVRTAAAVADTRLRASLANATDTFAERKASATSQLADWDGLRGAGRAVRADVLANLPDILARFANNVLAAGGNVCWAATGDDASRYIADVIARRGATEVVKSKSMTTEEIGLNHVLEGGGTRVTETDLGEWIIQLARETPSHIIVPAIHRDRHQIAEVLSQVADGDLAAVPEELAAFAREKLRERFLAAGVGISGANFGVAETGSVVLVTNEGNGRLVTSVPPVHIAVMGMERVVRTWDQLDLMISLLPRAATGQAITTYTSVITGPRRPGETDGPDELHVVILDNGRSATLHGEFAEMLACIRCGACLNACPVYRVVGGHAYGSVFSGPMGAVLTPLLLASKQADELPQASSLCGACWEACPVQIPLQDLLLAHRRRTAADHTPLAERLAWRTWAAAWSKPRRYRASLRIGRLGETIGFDHRGPAAGWSRTRETPAIAKRTFRDVWEAGEV